VADVVLTEPLQSIMMENFKYFWELLELIAVFLIVGSLSIPWKL
jgi:hypothetical protein